MRKLFLSVCVFLILFIFVNIASAKEDKVNIMNLTKFLCEILNSYDVDAEMYKYGEVVEKREDSVLRSGKKISDIYTFILETKNFQFSYKYLCRSKNGKKTKFGYSFTIKSKMGGMFKNLSEARQWLSQFGKIIIDDSSIAAVQNFDEGDENDYTNYEWHIEMGHTFFNTMTISWQDMEVQYFNNQFCKIGEQQGQSE